MKINKSDLGAIEFSNRTIEFQKEIYQKYYVLQKHRMLGFIPIGSDAQQIDKKLCFFNHLSTQWCTPILNAVNSEMSEQGENLGNIDVLTSHPLHRLNFLAAADILKKLNVPTDIAIRTFIKQIILVQCKSLIAASSPRFLGIVVMAPKDDWHQLDYVENFIHEASHIDLFIRQLIDPMIEENALLESPLRKTKRPAIAVLHAAFVLSRIGAALEQMIVKQIHLHESRRRLVNNKLKLAQAIATLQLHTKLTPLGAKLVKNIKKATQI